MAVELSDFEFGILDEDKPRYDDGKDHFPDIQFFNGGHGGNGGDEEFDSVSAARGAFVFPDSGFDYASDGSQFFPGNCVGYLETILEETDEEFEEDEEGCSGRHWWTADSDTDTESVIRLDPPSAPAQPFSLSASSVPFEMEDLRLLDQLDIAFEETLMEPRKRSGFALQSTNLQPIQAQNQTINQNTEPNEVSEEDFFYSTSEESSGASSDEEKTVLLAEFSLNPTSSFGRPGNRRSFDPPASSLISSKLRSFRSFDSLNSLAGSELLFSKPDSFPSFHYIGEARKEDSSASSPSTEEEEVRNIQSSENLSEDSGIGSDGQPYLMMVKSEFALNPFVYSSPEMSLGLGGERSLEDVEEEIEEEDPAPIKSESVPRAAASTPTDRDETVFCQPPSAQHNSPSTPSSSPSPSSPNSYFHIPHSPPKSPEPSEYPEPSELTELTEYPEPSESTQYTHPSEHTAHSEYTELSETKEFSDTETDQTITLKSPQTDETLGTNELNGVEAVEPVKIPSKEETIRIDVLINGSEGNIVEKRADGVKEDPAVPRVILKGGEGGRTLELAGELLISPPDLLMDSPQKTRIKTVSYPSRESSILSSRTPSPILKPCSPSPTSPTSPLTISTSLQSSLASPTSVTKLPKSPTSPSQCKLGEEESNGNKPRVTFSPVVSEISWRESYTDGNSSDFSSDEPHEVDGDPMKVEVSVEDEMVRNESEDEEIPGLISNKSNEASGGAGRLEDSEIRSSSSGRSNLNGNVPDLLSQCTNSETVIDVKIIETPTIEVSPSPKQILPTIFVDKGKKKKEEKKVPEIKLKEEKKKEEKRKEEKVKILHQEKSAKSKEEKENGVSEGDKKIEKNQSPKMKEEKRGKPGFFERLTKIRLSGNKKKVKKEGTNPSKESNEEEEAKKNVVLTNVTFNGREFDTEEDLNKSNSAFDNILEEIAGLKGIREREAKKGKGFAQRKIFFKGPPEVGGEVKELDVKLSEFKEEAEKRRIDLPRPNPGKIEESVRDSISVTMRINPEEGKKRWNEDGVGKEKTEREWYKLLKTAAEKYYRPPMTNKSGIVETDLDTGTSRELLENEVLVRTSCGSPKTRSLTNLSTGLKLSLPPQPLDFDGDEERAKSLEFLLDDENSASIPVENNLRNRPMSEHELRIQRSLQKLDVPTWFKDVKKKEDEKPALLQRRSEFGSGSGLAGGWAGLSAYKAPSLSSLQNSGRYAGSLNRSHFVRGRVGTRSSRESLLSPNSTASQSPSAFERSSFTYGMPFTMRLNGSRLNSAASSVSPPSTPIGVNSASYVKRPYLGWRSQERLNAATNENGNLRLSAYKPPEERLAAEVLSNKRSRPPLPKPPPRAEKTKLTTITTTTTETKDVKVHESIKQVSKEISTFVAESGEAPRAKPRVKPRKQMLWIESSFVGRKPST